MVALGNIGHSQFNVMLVWHNNEEIKEAKQAKI
jgi:hypothetical protein